MLLQICKYVKKMPCLQGVSEVGEIRNKTNMPVNIENRKNSLIYFWRVGTAVTINAIESYMNGEPTQRKAGNMITFTIQDTEARTRFWQDRGYIQMLAASIVVHVLVAAIIINL